ncbi:MAG: hypothetical protein IIZ36_02735 [Ruminococcus sp.]|jgi:hypothetical protein|nr:hypothetical protein [Ruminococcus sp.]MBQ2094229.1 hypothetical protein [Ruminococcus sp.]MBQ7744180.1 hypothetical protein [Ruminococcus sp.]MDO4882105.1 hypothetical protein [Oscillospiraceae bacterium]
MKRLLKFLLVIAGVFLIIHRRVIWACVTGTEMPQPPEWHKKFIPCLNDKVEDDL